MKNELDEFKKLCQPLVDYLNENGNPHQKIIITQSNAELVEGKIGVPFEILD